MRHVGESRLFSVELGAVESWWTGVCGIGGNPPPTVSCDDLGL